MHPSTIRLQTRNHLDRTAAIHLAALGRWLQHLREVVRATGRELQPPRRREITPIRHGGHLQSRFSPIEERVEHLLVEVPRRQLLLGEAVVRPHRVRRRVVVLGQVFRALAGTHDVKAGGAGPVHHLGNQRRLIAVGHRVDDAGLARLPRQERTRQHVRLDVDHDNVLLVRAAQQHVPHPGRRAARDLEHDVDTWLGDQRRRVGRDGRLARLQALRERQAGVVAVLGKTRALQRAERTLSRQVGDGGESDALGAVCL